MDPYGPYMTSALRDLPSRLSAPKYSPPQVWPTKNGDMPMSQITDAIWIGGQSSLSGSLLSEKGIYDVINTAIEFHLERPDLVDWADLRRRGIAVTQIDWDDTLSYKIYPTRSMEVGIKKIQDVVNKGGQVLVNCAMGKSRSVSLVMAYFIKCCGLSYDEALRLCKSRRSIAQPNSNFEKQLRAFENDVRRPSRGSNESSAPSRQPQSPISFTPSLKLPPSPSTPTPSSPSSPPPYWSASRSRSPLPSRDYDNTNRSREWEAPKKPELPGYFTSRLRDEYGLSSPRTYSRFDVPRTSLADPIFPPSPVTGRSSYPPPNSYSPSSYGASDFLNRAFSPSRSRNPLLDKFDSHRGATNDFVPRRLSL